MTCALSLFKIKLVCAEPASLSRPNQPDPAAGQGRDSWRPGGMQELPEGDEYADQPPTGLHSEFHGRGPPPWWFALVTGTWKSL